METEVVPLSWTSIPEWCRMLANRVNAVLNGKLNTSGTVTLTAGATSTTKADPRCTARTCVVLTPQTSTAAVAVGAGVVYVVPDYESFVVHHNNTADTDRTFAYALLG